jgi:hypothetical protein
MIKSDDSRVHVEPLLQRVKRKWQDVLAETRPENEADFFIYMRRMGVHWETTIFWSWFKKSLKMRLDS